MTDNPFKIPTALQEVESIATDRTLPAFRDENEGCTCGDPICSAESKGFNRGWNAALARLQDYRRKP